MLEVRIERDEGGDSDECKGARLDSKELAWFGFVVLIFLILFLKFLIWRCNIEVFRKAPLYDYAPKAEFHIKD